ncbi:MAG: hypothetical protein ABIR32_04440, partial [Ilumatobacteraceae bacterium]
SRPATTFKVGLCHATIAAERASFGSVLSIRPRSNRRTREDSFRWDVDDVFAGSDELLGQQRAHPGRSFHRPDARREPCRPRQQVFALMVIGDHA